MRNKEQEMEAITRHLNPFNGSKTYRVSNIQLKYSIVNQLIKINNNTLN